MGVNKWIGIGNLTRDPEVKYLANGTAVCNFSIACNERYKDKDGVKQESVEYVNIVAWKRLAEICGEYLKKGSQVFASGKLQTRSWEKDGVKRYSTEVVMQEMQMLGSRGESNQQDSGQEGTNPGDTTEDGGKIPF